MKSSQFFYQTISLPDQIAERIDLETKKAGFATRSEFVRTILRQHFSSHDKLIFEEFIPKPLAEIRRNLEKTGKYNKEFINSLIKGLKRSSFYARKTT